jgi:uncharacterized membrane protein
MSYPVIAGLVAVVASASVPLLYLLYGIDRSLWLDEANSVLIAKGSFSEIVDGLSRDGNPPLYYFLLSWTIGLFGDSEVAARLPSIVFYILGAIATFALARRVLGIDAAWLAAFLYLLSPVMGRHAQNARMYTMLPFFAACSALLFWQLASSRELRTKWLILHAIVVLAGLLTHYWFVFALCAEAIWVLVTFRSWTPKKLLLLFVTSTLPFALLWLPVFLQQSKLPSASWQQPPAPEAILYAVLLNFGIPDRLKLVLLIAITAAGALIIWRRRIRALDRGQAFLLTGCLTCFLLPFLVSQFKPMYYVGRYTTVGVPFLAVLAASGLSRLPRSWRLVTVAAVALNCAFYYGIRVHNSAGTQWLETMDPVPLGDRSAATYLCSQVNGKSIVVYAGLSRAAVQYYLERFGCERSVEQISFPAEVAKHPGWLDARRAYHLESETQHEAQNLMRRLRETAHSGMRVFVLVNERPLSQFLISRMKSELTEVRSVPFTGSLFTRIAEFSVH